MNGIASECSGKFAMKLALHRGDIVILIRGKREDPLPHKSAGPGLKVCR